VTEELDDTEREILRIGCAFHEEGAILNEIRTLDMGQHQFFQRLNALLDTERALAYDPVNVNRLRRLRAASLRKRF
jgi:hypothetical protein